MTQATDCATDFVVTEDMRLRHAAWVDEYAEAIFEMWRDEGQVDRDPEGAVQAIALVRGEFNVNTRPDWMHPLDAIAIKVMGEPRTPPTGDARVDHFDSMRTMAGMTRQQRLFWVSQGLGIGMEAARVYDLEMTPHDLSGPSCLYRYYDAQGVLLYVGITKDPDKRRRQHELRSEWYPHAGEPVIEWFDDRASALTAERAAIHDERPVFNRTGARHAPVEYAPTLALGRPPQPGDRARPLVVVHRRVDLRRGERLVPHERLHHANVHTLPQQRGGVGVAQSMR